jgi:hypothetical protein
MTFESALAKAEECANVATPMPMYRCHKEVWALKIKEVHFPPRPTIAELEEILKGDNKPSIGAMIVPEAHFAPFGVSEEFVKRHNPQAGGYFVQYKDGYTSFSPAAAFEEGYTRIS